MIVGRTSLRPPRFHRAEGLLQINPNSVGTIVIHVDMCGYFGG